MIVFSVKLYMLGSARCQGVVSKPISVLRFFFLIKSIFIYLLNFFSSAFRPFRHTATAIALFLLSCLCEVAQEVQTELNIATRQLTSEQIKNKNLRNLRNQDRMSSLRSKTAELTEKKQRLEIYFNDFFNGLIYKSLYYL